MLHITGKIWMRRVKVERIREKEEKMMEKEMREQRDFECHIPILVTDTSLRL